MGIFEKSEGVEGERDLEEAWRSMQELSTQGFMAMKRSLGFILGAVESLLGEFKQCSNIISN